MANLRTPIPTKRRALLLGAYVAAALAAQGSTWLEEALAPEPQQPIGLAMETQAFALDAD